MIHGLYAGGVILYQHQINTYAQTRQDIAHMQSRADFPLLISTDEEGWNVHRLGREHVSTRSLPSIPFDAVRPSEV